MDITPILTDLARPFPLSTLQLRVGATREDRERGLVSGLALPYAGWWDGYLPALTRYVGRGNFTVELLPWGQKVVAHLMAFGGEIEAWSSGEEDAADENAGTAAEAQAKKRACAEGLGLGHYLYFLPRLWGRVERQGRSFGFPREEEERIKHALYAGCGLDTVTPLEIAAPFRCFMPSGTRGKTPLSAPAEPPAPASAPSSRRSPGRSQVQAAPAQPAEPGTSPKLAHARAVLTDAEIRAGVQPAPTASDPAATEAQCHTIARHLAELNAADRAELSAIFAIDLRTITTGRAVAALQLSKQVASRLISQLRAWELSS